MAIFKKLIFSIGISLLLFSCGKTIDTGSVIINPPTSGDSLFLWQKISQIQSHAAFDIWFTSPSHGFAAVTDGNLYQSSDSGHTWTIIPNSGSNTMSNLMFVDAQHGFAQGANQLQLTRDGGNTWVLKNLKTTSGFNFFFVSPSTGYYTDIDSGMYKTLDTGTTWLQVYHPTQVNQGYYPFFLDPNNGAVASGDGKFSVTADGAVSWNQVATGVAVNTNTPNFNTLFFVDAQHGYYGTKTGLLKTTDGGVTWNQSNPHGGSVNVVHFLDLNTGYYLSDSAIYKTIDAGQSWTTSCKLGADVFESMHFIDANTGWACTSRGYILRLKQ